MCQALCMCHFLSSSQGWIIIPVFMWENGGQNCIVSTEPEPLTIWSKVYIPPHYTSLPHMGPKRYFNKGKHLHGIYFILGSNISALIILILIKILWGRLFFVLWLHPRHMEIPRPGVESEQQVPVYATATAMPDPCRLCDLCHSLQQCWILNTLSKARDPWTHVLTDVTSGY